MLMTYFICILNTQTRTNAHKHSKAVTCIQVKNYFALFQFQFHRKRLEIITNCLGCDRTTYGKWPTVPLHTSHWYKTVYVSHCSQLICIKKSI